MDTKLRDGIFWIGYVDWNVRDFHGYKTGRGSTYNAYLMLDEKNAVIDSVKAPYASNLLENIQAHIPLDKVDYLVVNHAEPDHSGSVPAVMQACPNVTLVCDEKCLKALDMHYDTEGWRVHIVKTGDRLSLGRRHLTFLETPMVHWPESMFTYVPEEKLLFSMDAFGQHFASATRFDDTENLNVIMAEAKTYYANIVMLYARSIRATLAAAGGLAIEMVAPSHGVIWRKHIQTILAAYDRWTLHKPERKVLVVFDSMWKSTEMMANAIIKGVMDVDGVDARLYNVNASHITELATEVLDASGVAVGSPTLNMTLMPQVACLLTYWKGLRPMNKVGFAFGSYGWSKNGGPTEVEAYLNDMKFELTRPAMHVQFVPNEEALAECRAAGRELAQKAIDNYNKLWNAKAL
ncbi:MAG TPA: MBL fold metallo-hydrolase [Verrucomicrobia bacterium]|nr:MBL fold metallo-hydrolase [Verrucomicrobiota bacterium]